MSNELSAIQQTLAAYCHRVDYGTADEVAKLFAQNSILMPYYDGKYDVHGRDGVRDWYAFYHQKMGETVNNLRHSISTALIDIDSDAANSVCYFTAYFTMKADDVAYQAQGTYFDKLAHTGGEWLIESRRIEVQYITRMGDVIESMKPMGFPGATE